MRKIMIWGTGEVAKHILSHCNTIDDYEVLGFIDNDKCKQGNIFWGGRVYAPDILREMKPDVIVILSNFYHEIVEQIASLFPEMISCIEDKNYFFKQSIIKRYEKTKEPEIIDVLSYIKNNGLGIFNYSFKEKYEKMLYDIEYDEQNDMFFVLHMGKRMYFSRKIGTRENVVDYYKSIAIEQDMDSPHKYLSSDFVVKEGDVVVDVGAAEGNFSLEVIDKASRIYIIETDEDWLEALRLTFKDYGDKVIIIPKYVTSYDEGKLARLDTVIQEPVNFIKMDIEGCEWEALLGAEELINKSDDIKFAVCSYHSDFDEELIESFFSKKRISWTTTRGYMWFPLLVKQNYISTKLNRAIVRAVKIIEKNE